MKKFANIMLVLCASILMFSCDQDDKDKSVLNVNIKGLTDKTVLVSRTIIDDLANPEEDRSVLDTVLVSRGKFKYAVETTEPLFIKVMFKSDLSNNYGGQSYHPETKFINLVLNPGEKISVNGKVVDDVIDYTVEGNINSVSLAELRKSYFDILGEKARNEVELFEVYFNGIEGKTEEETSEIFDEVYNKYLDIRETVSQKELEYINQNLDKEIIAYLISIQPIEVFGEFYDKISDEIKNGTFKSLVEKKYQSHLAAIKKKEAAERIVEGAVAPNFELTTINGDNFDLSSISDKYVILDFWASWCGYCIKAFPEMKQYYEKYSDKVEIVGIACRDKDEDWRESVSENELPWLQVKNNDDNIDLNVATMYGISGFPSMFLLDKDKNIVMKSVGFDHAILDKLDELFAK